MEAEPAADALPTNAALDDESAALLAAGDAITRAHWAELAARARRPLQRQARRCACALGGSCARCGRCMEVHCKCGARARHRGLCLESRPCDCVLTGAATRCALCRGCRRVEGSGHCCCEQHEHQRQRLHGDTRSDKAETSSSDMPCACFRVAASAIPRANAASAERTQRIRRLRRATGVPSVENLFRKTIVSAFGRVDSVDEAEADSAEMMGNDDLCSVLHRPLMKRMFPLSTYAPPYQQLYLRDGSSFLESSEPREHNERAFVSIGGGANARMHADQEVGAACRTQCSQSRNTTYGSYCFLMARCNRRSMR